MKRRQLIFGVFLSVLLLVMGVLMAWGFAEEEIGFRDSDGTYYPPQGSFPEGRVSTVHDDLTYALALAAGFSITDSQTLRIWDQLVDSETLPRAKSSYTLGNASFPTPPNPVTACVGKNHARQVWPAGQFDPKTAAVTSRYGPYSPFFHFPHLNGSDLRALRDWAWGDAQSLQGYAAYAWGRPTDLTFMQAVENGGCIITRTVTISMPVHAGSLEAFAVYLHTLADAYSHADCIAALAAHSPPAPWGTHTVPALGDTSIPACDYNPTHPTNDDAHGREFGSQYPDSQRTIAAARVVYTELVSRSRTGEGLYAPLSLNARLTVNGEETTLDGVIVHYATTWAYDEPAQRRAYLDGLVAALLSQRHTLTRRMYLPVLLRP